MSEELIRTQNLITGNPVEQEIATLKAILEDYENKRYNNMFILIMNYLGHVDHYCGHEGLVYRLLNLFTYNLEKGDDCDDTFVDFINRRIGQVEEGF